MLCFLLEDMFDSRSNSSFSSMFDMRYAESLLEFLWRIKFKSLLVVLEFFCMFFFNRDFL